MKYLTAAAGVFVVATFLMPTDVQAGASASAPSKYTRSSQFTVAHQVRQPRSPGFPITEYSSSSAKTTAPKR